MKNDRYGMTKVIDSQTYKLYASTNFIFVIKVDDNIFKKKCFKYRFYM